MEDLVTVSKKDLMRLVKRSLKLSALNMGGVDNWSYYSEALSDENHFDGKSFYDIEDLESDEFYNNYVKRYVK